MSALRLTAVMAVYAGDHPDAVRAAIDSVLGQTRPADEFVIVIDGPIGTGLEDVITAYADQPIITICPLVENQGRGPARNHAIANASGEVIVMMDADDICRPDRFAVQLAYLIECNLDVVGGFIEEFDDTPGDKGSIRAVPLTATDIASMVRFRSAFNHVTLMYRRAFFQEIGGYSDLNFVEDWDFYQRTLYAGGKVANMDRVLVDVRAVQNRRRNLAYFYEEMFVLRAARARRQIGVASFILSVIVRVIKLIMPDVLFSALYRSVLRRQAK